MNPYLLTIALLTADDAWARLAELRKGIVDVEFETASRQGKADGQRGIKEARPLMPEWLRFHRDGVYFRGRYSDQGAPLQFHDESNRLDGEHRYRTSFFDPRNYPSNYIEPSHQLNPASDMTAFARLWPQLYFMVRKSDYGGPLVSMGRQQRGGVETELFEWRGSWWTVRYWLDMNRQGALVECDELDKIRKSTRYRIHSVEHATIADGRGGLLWHPVRGLVDSGDTRISVELVPGSLKVNTGRSADATEVQYAPSAWVIDKRDPAVATPAIPEPTKASLNSSLWLVGSILALVFAAAFWSTSGSNGRRFVRGIWCVMWAVWVFLGVGLYWQLPREFGPVVCRLAREQGDFVVGFVDSSNEVLVFRELSGGQATRWKIFNAESGVNLRTVDGPPRLNYLGAASTGVRHGCLFAHGVADPDRKSTGRGVHRLNLAAGKWSSFTDQSATYGQFNSERPWLLLTETHSPYLRIRRVTLLDVHTGKVLFSREASGDLTIDERPQFCPTNNSFILATTTRTKGSGLEVWRIGETVTQDRFLAGVTVGPQPSMSDADRLVCRDANDPTLVVALDLQDGRKLLSRRQELRETKASWSGRNLPAISRNGKTMFAGKTLMLWDVDTGAELWRPNAFENPRSGQSDAWFTVNENWSELLKDRLPNLKYESVARRSVENAEVIVRVKGPSLIEHVNQAGTLGVAYDGTVHRMPYRVDYPLLALCQTILALPLLLTWLALRWRRNRRLRLAGEAS